MTSSYFKSEDLDYFLADFKKKNIAQSAVEPLENMKALLESGTDQAVDVVALSTWLDKAVDLR